MRNVRIALSTNRFRINSAPMKIGGIQFVAKLGWPIVALIDHQSRMRMTTTSSIGRVRHALHFGSPPVLFADIPMKVVCRLFDYAVQMRIKMRTIHSS